MFIVSHFIKQQHYIHFKRSQLTVKQIWGGGEQFLGKSENMIKSLLKDSDQKELRCMIKISQI